MIIQNELQKLGFGPADAELYLALLKVGESPVGALIKATGMHREIVYGGLTRLEQQGLVQSIEKKKIRHYQALDPKELSQKMQEKAQLAKDLLPDLHKLYKQTPVSVRIYEGREGFEEIQKDIAVSLKDKEEYFVIGGAGKAWYEVTADFYKKYHRRLQKRGIICRTVTFANEALGIAEYELPGFNPIRVLPDHFSVPSSTMIYADKIIIQVFGESPIAIMIRSDAVSKSYKQYFNTLWMLGSPA